MRGAFGNASTSNAPLPVTRLQSRPPIGSGNHTSVSPCGCSSRQLPSCHERTDARRACRTAATLLGPAQPTRATRMSSTARNISPAWATNTSARPGANPAPSAIVTSALFAFGCERADRLDRVLIVVARDERDTRGDGRGGDRMVVAGRERARDHVDAFGNRVTRRERVHRGLLTERVDDLGHAVAVGVGQQHLDDARGVDQLAGGTGADGADTGDEHSHRNSGASSSRQPPLVGGTPPLPRKRAINPTRPARPKTRSTRRKAFTARDCIEQRPRSIRPGRARRRIATIDAFPGL